MGRNVQLTPPTDPPMVAAERAEFEIWARAMGYRIDRSLYDWVYKDRRANNAWSGWIARATR